MHSTDTPSMRQGRDRTLDLCQHHHQACTLFPCSTRTHSAFVGRATGSQCAPPHGWTRDDPTVRHPRRLCDFARFGNGLTLPRLPWPSLFSDRHASLSGASWPFFPAFPPFLLASPLWLSIPRFLPPPTRGASRSAQLSFIKLEINSSTTSLRNSWDQWAGLNH